MEIEKQKFLQIIEENNHRLRHLCKVYAAGSFDAKDLYQEIVIQLWRSLPAFEGKAELNTWVYRVALNVSVSFVRKKETRTKYHKAYKAENTYKQDVEQNNLDENEIKIEHLYKAISQLNASEKAMITMYLDDFSYAEIAKVVDITENYVGVKLNRIKRKLTQIVKEDYEI